MRTGPRLAAVSAFLVWPLLAAGQPSSPAAANRIPVRASQTAIQKVPLSYIAYSEPTASGVNDRNTVSTGPDNGANNCSAAHFWNVKRHGTTAQAVDNVLIPVSLTVSPGQRESIRGTGGANVSGHGNEGLLTTGMGQTGPFEPNQFIYRWNESVWGPQLDRIIPTPITMMSIWSCHTGAGDDGAELLYAMAKRIGRAVRARTGFTYCGQQGISFENGSVWQVATPEFKPNPIPPPSPHGLLEEPPLFETKTGVHGYEAVTNVVVTRLHLGHPTQSSAKSIPGAEAARIVRELIAGPAIDMTGITIPGLVTARIELTFAEKQTVALDVYNGRFGVDSQSATGYYVRGLQTLLAY